MASKNENGTIPGRFQPGNRMGKGRPHGSRNKASIAIQAMLDGQSEALTQTAINLALDGNETALKLCLDRLLPPKKDRHVRLRLPSITTAAGVADATDALLQAVSKGEVTPAEAGSISVLLEARRRAIETSELEARIEAIEQGGAR